jgi:transcriptional regulator with PAS, ATPase and Fis domain
LCQNARVEQIAPATAIATSLTGDLSEQLLMALGSVLDIRQVFPQISDIAKPLLPHDRLTMTLHDGQQTCIAHAASNDDGPFFVRVTGPGLSGLVEGTHRIIEDLAVDTPGLTFDPPDHRKKVRAAGYRSVLTVVLAASEQRFALHFWSKRVGAFDPTMVPLARHIAVYVAMGISHEQLAETARQAAAARADADRLTARVEVLSRELEVRAGYGRRVGQSAAWTSVIRLATQVAATDTTVLLTGESGTGKEVIARYIHRASARNRGPFIAVNCAALPEQLLESELFGHERGAFTGAEQAKPGQIELAAGGVLLLDEVGEMSLSAQAKFLRVLQEREFQRLGGTRLLKADVRVIAATNRDLRAAMERDDFREDLYYRLQVFDIHLPPLRDRPEDILQLSEAFLEDIGRSFGREPAGITREAKQALLGYRWPGNVRELRNVLERAAIVCEGGLIAPEHLAIELSRRQAARTTTDVKAVERQLIEQALRESRGNKSRAAIQLGLTRKELYGRLKQYGLD